MENSFLNIEKKNQYSRRKVLKSLSVMVCSTLLFAPISLANATSLKTSDMALVAQQSGTIVKGFVSDKMGPIIGATVTVKGTRNGTASGLDGDFKLSNIKKGDVLIISYIGYTTQEVKYTGQALDIKLNEDSHALSEVVVVGFGTQKKVNVTGAVSAITSDVLKSRPVQNVGQALQGVIPGLNFSVNTSGGELNNTMSVNVRGSGSIGDGSNSAPLILIDGMEGNMNAINPNDIDNISVLKDASSSSIYGSRAAFGVILITTKSGKAGRTSVNYSSDVRFVDALAIPKMMDSYTFAQYFNRASSNDGQMAVFDDNMMGRILAYQKGELLETTTPNEKNGLWNNYSGANANTNWFKEQYRDWVPSQEHRLSVNGGTDKLTYLISGSFLDQTGLVRHGGDKFQRYNLNGRINAKLSEKISLNYSTKWIREDYDRPSYLSGLFYHNIARRWPTCPVYDNNGYYMEGVEIIQMRDGGRAKSQKDYSYNQMQIVIEPIKDWNIYLEGNMSTVVNYNHSDKLPVYAHNVKGEPYLMSWDGGAAGASSVSESTGKENFYTANLYTNYSRLFKGGHYAKVTAGFNSELMKTRSISASKDGVISAEVPTLNTSSENPSCSGGYAHWSTAGFFSRLNYNFNERYLLEANVRLDGTSRFVGDKRWGIFPSFSLGWNIAKEDFFKPLSDKISTLKLRASWGELGNTNTKKLYPFFLTMPFASNAGGWLVDGKKPNIASAPSIVNALMTWEEIRSWNVGLDWSAFNNRLTGSLDFFKRQTKDMIGPPPEVSNILGVKTEDIPRVNNADMESYGFDLELGWRDQISDLNYGLKLVLSDDKQKVTRYPNKVGDVGQWYSGRMAGEIWGYETIGIAKSNQEMADHIATLPNGGQTIGKDWAAGDIMYKDLNGDGKIDAGSSTLSNPGDRKIIGNSSPRFKFGFTMDADWKGFDLKLFFQGVLKRDYLLGGPYFWGASGGMWQSAGFKEHFDFFRPEGDPLGANLNAYYPRPLFVTGDKNQQGQTRYLQNAAYIRLKNIQLGYSLSQNVLSKVGLQSVRLYVSGDNLWTASQISGVFDPETIGGGWGDGKLYPLSKTISVGINVNF